MSNLDSYLSAVVGRGLYSSEDNLRFHLEFLFDGVPIEGKRMLDIGGGSGMYSFYAGARGAANVVCMEPEAAGSTSNVTKQFEALRTELGFNHVALETSTIQQYDPGDATFDVILMHNAINHLDEDACIRLRRDESARQTYRQLFREIGALASVGARLVVCDCSNQNFFGQLGMTNPFARTIEWHKHQAPELWSKLLRAGGFTNSRIRWTPVARLAQFGGKLAGNRLVSYFLTSHFCLQMVKTEATEGSDA